MISRRSVLATLGALVGTFVCGFYGLVGLGIAQISPWFDISKMTDIPDPVPLIIRNHDPVDHTVEVTITDERSGGTVFEETVDIEAATGEEMTSVEFEDVTSTVGEYRVTAELDTGETGDYILDPLDHVLFNITMPPELIISIGSEYGPRKVWVSGTGNPP